MTLRGLWSFCGLISRSWGMFFHFRNCFSFNTIKPSEFLSFEIEIHSDFQIHAHTDSMQSRPHFIRMNGQVFCLLCGNKQGLTQLPRFTQIFIPWSQKRLHKWAKSWLSTNFKLWQQIRFQNNKTESVIKKFCFHIFS